jgi:hypothetical protein
LNGKIHDDGDDDDDIDDDDGSCDDVDSDDVDDDDDGVMMATMTITIKPLSLS